MIGPSPVSGSPSITCAAEPAWCTSGGGVSVPPGGSEGLPPLTQSSSSNTALVETLTEADGSTVTLTIPSESGVITGITTVVTDGSTLTLMPIETTLPDTITSTMTTTPAGLSAEIYTDSSLTSNRWLTTTGSDSSTTIVPIILPCATCPPEIIWGDLEIPHVEFVWPKFPRFHLPCIKIFGLHIAGTCPSPSGPAPITDGPPGPEPSKPPAPDICEVKLDTGMCENGNHPVFDAGSATIRCDVTSDQLEGQLSQCQREVDDIKDAVADMLSNDQGCCPAATKTKRDHVPGLFGMNLDGLRSLSARRPAAKKPVICDYKPEKDKDPRKPPAGEYYATFTCDHAVYPNVCGNAKSAIVSRGATSILTHHRGSTTHNTDTWYASTLNAKAFPFDTDDVLGMQATGMVRKMSGLVVGCSKVAKSRNIHGALVNRIVLGTPLLYCV